MSEPTDGDQAGGNTDDIGAPVEVVEDALARSPSKALAEAMTAWMKTRRPPRCKTRYKVGRSRPESTAPLPLIPMDRMRERASPVLKPHSRFGRVRRKRLRLDAAV